MIIVRLIGGLGNQMFQYALGRQLAVKNNSTLKLDIQGFNDYKLRNYDLSCFNILENIATSNDLSGVVLPSDRLISKVGKHIGVKLKGIQQIQYIKEKTFNFQQEILNMGDNIYLDGYWQSEKYFSDIKKIIKKDFTVKNRPDPINESIMKEITECESVSIHIRRGDYVSNPTTSQYHGFLGLEYYQRAMRLMLEKIDNPYFFVFSDDPDWASENIKTDSPVTYIKHNGDKNYEDMRLISTCKHHIIANSSFSWWGAWLSKSEEKVVIAPRKWFNVNTLDTKDLYLDYWNKM
ncbi:MAG: alpha-1,2-fucosyltransferase [Methanosarcina mazei]|mgnify:CR=1 FL=1|uniref:alpha-1,2-fucosyltransferase n=1 Tax=Methanosarcina soligelidi TaxID=1036677 RepID=UPI00064E6568|nr:alpha-1,2-fucosyltransferase [Methanosarcina soligelidi]